MYRMDGDNLTEDLIVSDFESFPLESAKISFAIRQFVMPFICICGFIGNSFSVSTFLRTSMRSHSCSLLLATRGISDNGFLITVFIVWLDFVNVRVFHVEGVCQVTLFLSFTCSFLSVWCVLVVTAENYVRMCHPASVATLCTTRRAVYLIIVGVTISVVVYNFPLWAAGVDSYGGQTYCLTKENYRRIEMALIYIDSSLTLVIPLLLILYFMSMIIYSSVEARKRFYRLNNQRMALLSEPRARRTESPHSKVTRLLFVVTCLFLILHTPSHVIRMKAIMENLVGAVQATSETDRILQQLFQVLYYMNFSVNIGIYLGCGSNFRKVFCQTFCNRRIRRSESLQEIHENEQLRSTDIVLKELYEESETSP